MAHKMHKHLPLTIFGLCAAPVCITSLLGLGTVFSYELAAIIGMLMGILVVVATVQYWRHS